MDELTLTRSVSNDENYFEQDLFPMMRRASTGIGLSAPSLSTYKQNNVESTCNQQQGKIGGTKPLVPGHRNTGYPTYLCVEFLLCTSIVYIVH